VRPFPPSTPPHLHITPDLTSPLTTPQLMAHADPDVQKQALLCVQRIMLSRGKLDWLGTAAS